MRTVTTNRRSRYRRKCRQPDKHRFATEAAAQASAVHREFALGKPFWPYECRCGWFHLTSKPPRKGGAS